MAMRMTNFVDPLRLFEFPSTREFYAFAMAHAVVRDRRSGVWLESAIEVLQWMAPFDGPGSKAFASARCRAWHFAHGDFPRDIEEFTRFFRTFMEPEQGMEDWNATAVTTLEDEVYNTSLILGRFKDSPYFKAKVTT